jgi:hypothetical protein
MVTNEFVIVSCGGGTGLCLYKVQLEGFDEQDAPQILKFGQRLG